MGDQAGALEDYNTAISLKPNYAEAYNNRGVLKSNMGDQAGALEDYNKAVSLKPNYAKAYNNRASCYQKLAEIETVPSIKTDLITKAEADKQIAASLL